MKPRTRITVTLMMVFVWVVSLGFGLTVTSPRIAWAQESGPQGALALVGTAFTYQGELTDDQGTPLTGQYDFEFRLYDASGSGAAQVESAVTADDTQVDGGRFTVALNFGSDAFTGEARWLEIRVREGASTGGYTTLTPRQALTPAPYALALPGLRTDPSAAVPNILGGYAGNVVDGGVSGATIGGGGGSGQINRVTGDHGTVGGGSLNVADVRGTVGGGQNNQAGSNATVGGGLGNAASDQGATVGGGQDNSATYLYGTVGGGLHNTVSAYGATIAGGAPANPSDLSGTRNRVVDHYGTIGGGGNNLAGSQDGTSDNAQWATVGGGQDNAARAEGATVGGGTFNRAYGYRAVVAGGSTNYATGQYAAVVGGFSNSASDNRAAIGGGDQNQAAGPYATVAGGRTNVAGGTDVYHATVGGGVDNEATGSEATVSGGNGNAAGGRAAAVPGGFANEAGGNYSLASGYRAKADHSGTFVWADARKADFASTADDQFLIRAGGGVGIGTNAPDTVLHTVGVDAGTQTDPAGHIALVEDTNNDGDNQVLAVKTGYTGDPTSNNNFVTFFNGSDAAVGAIEGNNAGGVSYASGGADFAEFLPRLNADEDIEPAEIVGLFGDAVTQRTDGASRVFVVSSQPVVVGNDPGQSPGTRADYEKVALVGQVPVKVQGAVRAGDYVVPSGREDGIGVAVSPDEIAVAQIDRVVGQALEGRHGSDVGQVSILVGLSETEILQTALRRRDARLDSLEARIAALEAAIGDDATQTQSLSE
jgi:hypothetical protein